MAIDSSKFFDSIRVKPNKLSAKQQAAAREEAQMCEAPGCKNRGAHRAPKGRGHEKDYWHFCLNHVREYNQGYNFFQGMSDDAVATYQKDAQTGHRPTWKMGQNGAKGKGKTGEVDLDDTELDAPNDFRACVSFLRQALPEEQMASLLMASGRLPLGDLPAYASVVVRAMDEIRQLLRDKATNDIKRRAGIR